MYHVLTKEFSDEPVMTLQTLIKVYSTEILIDQRKLEKMLKDNDKFNEFQREIYLLILSLKAEIPYDMIGLNDDSGSTYQILSYRLQEKYLIKEEAAQWAVSSWAKALEIAKHPQKRRVEDVGSRIKSEMHFHNHLDRSGVIMWNIPHTRN